MQVSFGQLSGHPCLNMKRKSIRPMRFRAGLGRMTACSARVAKIEFC